jgi:formate dehydrogenase subunit delta
MSTERLVSMANQIARFFEAQPDGRAAEQTANHLRSFWDPRMRSDLITHARTGGSGLGPTATAAAALLEHPIVLAASERNPIGSGDGSA